MKRFLTTQVAALPVAVVRAIELAFKFGAFVQQVQGAQQLCGGNHMIHAHSSQSRRGEGSSFTPVGFVEGGGAIRSTMRVDPRAPRATPWIAR